ncbi:hypothetical protein [Clostridium porci]|uniref:Uncharacterized protein n=1 Tax=Clostridium porci TaxID=2605778 RepID=A0A7X2TD23_9CLOT|nr:hypothetical protein [Clostridium porci]MSS36506.1 hypothetical protein [Clostridium porci]
MNTEKNEKETARVCGIQYPGEEGITKEDMESLLQRFAGFYMDVVRIDEPNGQSSATFLIESDLYAEWEESGELERFKEHFAKILGDQELEQENGRYFFAGVEVWLTYPE